MQPTNTFRVYIGNGNYLVCKYEYVQVELKLQQYQFTIDMYVLPIEWPDLVLGIQWLQRLGRICHDYAAMTMEFNWNNVLIVLRDDGTTLPDQISFQQLQVIVDSEEFHSFYEIHFYALDGIDYMNVGSDSLMEFPIKLPVEISVILTKYSCLFLVPNGCFHIGVSTTKSIWYWAVHQ